MRDLEREIRLALQEDAQGAPPPADLGKTLRRTHGRQARVVATTAIAGAILLIGMVAGTASVLHSSGPIPAAPVPRPDLSPSRPVAFSIRGIKGAAGDRLAAVLFSGRDTSYLNDETPGRLPSWHPVGGFATSIKADPFSTTQVVHQPYDSASGKLAFPSVSSEVLHVPPGTYTLVLYVGPRLVVIPYGRWRLLGTPGLRACRMTFLVEAGQGRTTVKMNDPALAEWDGQRWLPWNEHPPPCMRA